MIRATARVDLGAVERNCARLRELAGTRLCAVVKADGYGHGDLECARAALRGGAEWLAVATVTECVRLRAAGIDGPVLIMGALSRDEAAAVQGDVVAWRSEFLDRLPEGTGVHVKLDTGMGRLGTRDPEEALAVARAVAESPRLRLAGLMTHFATADDDAAYMREQLARFHDWVKRVDALGALVHAANSAAAIGEPAARLDMVRCGIAVYGMDPFHRDPADHGLEPALELSSWVAEVKACAPGEGSGYGRRFVADRQTVIGTLPIGYADGVRRALTNNADVLIAGRRYPLVGTVSMDNVTVDLGPDGEHLRGEEAVLIGAQGSERILAEEVAARIATINYEVATGISQRVPREYR